MNPHNDSTIRPQIIVTVAAWAVFFLQVVYAIITVLGFLSLTSPNEPIGDPYFTLMELLILVLAPLMVVCMVGVHYHASSENKVYSLTALVFMILLAGTTSSVHFIVLIMTQHSTTDGLSWLLSFRWPSVVYVLDILAWDWFFAFSMLFAATVFKSGRLENSIRTLMIISGTLSLAGLIGVPLANMQLRNIGIIGYGIVAPFVFLLLGILFRRKKSLKSSVL